MPAEIRLYDSPDRTDPLDSIALSDVHLPLNQRIAEGEPVHVFARNTGTTAIKDLSVNVSGEVREQIQLAIDKDGEPGVWAAAGEPIRAASMLASGQDFSFWARGFFTYEDHEGDVPFEIAFRGVSIG